MRAGTESFSSLTFQLSWTTIPGVAKWSRQAYFLPLLEAMGHNREDPCCGEKIRNGEKIREDWETEPSFSLIVTEGTLKLRGMDGWKHPFV